MNPALLEPCPFCGEPPEFETVRSERPGGLLDRIRLRCTSTANHCKMIVEAYGKTRDEATARWNRRTP